MCCSMHILFQPCPHLFCGTGAVTRFAHHSCSLLVFPVYNRIIFAVATGRSKYTGALGFGKCCWCWLEMLLYWKQRFSVLTAKETQVQILWDLSRLLEQNLIPQQQGLCFALRVLWQRSWKVNHLCPKCLVALPKGWVISPLPWSVGRNRHCRTGSSALRNRSDSSCPDRHRKCRHGASRGAEDPHRNPVEQLV